MSRFCIRQKMLHLCRRNTNAIINVDICYINSGKSCCPWRKNTSSMTFTHPPSMTLTLMQSISFQPHSDSSLSKLLALLNHKLVECHPATSWGLICEWHYKLCQSGGFQCLKWWTSGQWWCWWGSTALARPPSSGTYWSRWECHHQGTGCLLWLLPP